MRYFGYARVSSKDQNLDRQIESLNGLKKKMLIYKDICSGKDFERPAYKKMVEELEEGDVLYISSLDRLGRNYTEIQDEWAKITKEKKAEIRVIDMPILNTGENKDMLQTLISDIVLQILAFVAENERKNIRARQAEGIACAKRNGVKFGRPRTVLPEDFQELVRLYKSGEMSMEEVLVKCGISRSTYYRKISGCR